MGFKLSTGVKYALGTTTGSPVTISGISNAATAVVSAAAHGLVAKTPFIMSSGWEELTDSVFRVSNPLTGSFELEGINSSDTTLYPAGTGAGTATPITAWLDIPQIVDVSTSGGDIKFIDVQLLSQRYGIKIPNGVNGASIEFEIAADRSLAAWAQLQTLSRAQKPLAIRKTNPGGEVSYGYGYFFISPVEKDSVSDVQKVSASLTTMRPFVSYATA